MNTQHGFTLPELTASLVIAGVLTALAIPSFTGMIRATRLTSTTNDVIASLHYARSEAVKRNTAIIVKPITGNQWETGWTVAISDCTVNCVLRSYSALPAPLTLRGSLDNAPLVALTYSNQGAIEKTGYLILCDTRLGNVPQDGYVKAIRINYIGLTNLAKDTNANGVPEIDNQDLTTCNP